MASDGTWGTAQEVPGTGVLNQGGSGWISSVSCGAAGNCSAGGHYKDGSGDEQAFVASEANEAWGTAQEVPGTAALNTGGAAAVASVSCPSAGNCSAGGTYTDSSGNQAFVVSETNGTWGTAEQVLRSGGIASVSCPSAGNCTAIGSGHGQVFAIAETNGVWGTAHEVPTSALNPSGGPFVVSMSCASSGNCSAVGNYTDGLGYGRVFAAGEVNGTWGMAKEIPGVAALSQGGQASIIAVSCAAAGNCTAGGDYTDSFRLEQAFVVSEASGAWGTAQEVPGIAEPSPDNASGPAQITSVSCAWPRNCSAVGYYPDSSGNQLPLEAAQVQGTWVTADEVPGTGALGAQTQAAMTSVSCRRAGSCSAGGYYYDSSGNPQALVATAVDWIWGGTQEVPGLAALNQGGPAEMTSVSCASPGHCSGGGFYTDSSGNQQVFVVDES